MTAAMWVATVVAMESGSAHPSDLVRSPCGSVSTSSTRLPRRASATPRLSVVAVLPVPPFWLATAIALHGMLLPPFRGLAPRPGRSEDIGLQFGEAAGGPQAGVTPLAASPPLPRIGFEDRRSQPDDFGRSRWNWTEIPRFFQCEPIDSSKGWIAKTAV